MTKIAVVGATGNVGREILSILAERNFPAKEIIPLASPNSLGKQVSYGNKILNVKILDDYDFSDTDIALFSPGSKISSIYGPKAASSGCVVIDNTSYFRMDKDIPLIVPEVNPHHISQFKKKNIIANPNCSTIQMLVALKPIHELCKIKRIIVSTYQSVSGAGKSAMDELYDSTKKIYENQFLEPVNFTKRIAFNAVPHIDLFMEDDYTKEEWKMKVETHKILDKNIKLTATCVRLPIFVCHGESINIECENSFDVNEIKDILSNADGVSLIDDPKNNKYITPIDAAGKDDVFVSRVRRDDTVENGLNLWVVADNLRKGAALNAVQIAEMLLKDNLI